MPLKIQEAVVVITGASSGIGRATALEFARKGATLLLAARQEEALEELAHLCEQQGGRAIAVPTDVTDEAAVRTLAQRAIDHFGRIDVWVNNAAVTLFARFDEAPSEAYRQVIETNLFGYIHGARAVLPYFRIRGRGVLINVDSVVASAPQPYTSAYVISKYGIRALSDCLRMELNLDHEHDIHVCTVMPAAIDTPLFQHAANYTGRAAQPPPPVYPAEQVALAITGLVEKPKRQIVVGAAGHMMTSQYKMMPALYERTAAPYIHDHHFQDKAAPPTNGNLFEPMSGHNEISGGWLQPGQVSTRRIVALGALLVPALLGWLWLRPRGAPRALRDEQMGRLSRFSTESTRRQSTLPLFR